MAGVKHNLSDPEYAEIFAQNARLAGMVDLDEYSMKDLRARIAGSIGVSPEKLEKTIEPMERIYAVVDHTRCLAYMLGDGIIPSNVKAGYLARLVIRRTLRLMKELGLVLPLEELVQMQIARLDYPDWQERFVTIKEILDQEEQKYGETLEKGKRLVKKTAESYRKKNQAIPLQEMISLYDTHGIPPEIARESAEELGATVELPDNFYSLVAKKHIKAEEGEAPKLAIPGKTELMFYEHPFDQVFEAEVLVHEAARDSEIIHRQISRKVRDAKQREVRYEKVGELVFYKPQTKGGRVVPGSSRVRAQLVPTLGTKVLRGQKLVWSLGRKLPRRLIRRKGCQPRRRATGCRISYSRLGESGGMGSGFFRGDLNGSFETSPDTPISRRVT